MKKTTLAAVMAALCLQCAQALDTPFFSGYAGGLAELTGQEAAEDKTPLNLTLQGFVAGQLDFGGKLLVGAEVFLKAPDLLNNDPFSPKDELNTVLTIGEVSATWRFTTGSIMHFASAFLGKFEPIGSDLFLQRHLGIKPILSPLLESWSGLAGASIFSSHGIGGAYTAHFNKRLVLGAYLNMYTEGGLFKFKAMNSEIRFAGLLDSFIFDSSVGFSFEGKVGGADYLLQINSVIFKIGANMLVGDRSGTSVFIQLGLDNVYLTNGNRPDDEREATKWYLFVEPRFSIAQTQFAVALFSMPYENTIDLLYLNHNIDQGEVLGANLSVTNKSIHLGDSPLSLGGHVSLYFSEFGIGTMLNKGTPNPENLNVAIIPTAQIPLLGGQLKASLALYPMDFIRNNWRKALSLTVGFKASM